uniref:Zinc finger CCHC domain-containing protein 7 n=2 Tax=Eptatretus burgeri TaxID=7764 RepID=A0A8C4Q723_EPTBU
MVLLTFPLALRSTYSRNTFGKWAMNNRDLQACIVNQKRATVKGAQSKGRLHKKNSRPYDWCNKQKPHFQARRQGRKHPRCNICGNLGHLRVTCPFLPCYLCRCPGHLAQDCIEGPTNSQCRRCRMMGHIVDDCPDIWRQFHLTTQCGPIIQGAAYNYCQEQPKFCYNCAGCGHFGHECHRKRMGNGIFPTTPFVCHYDHNREIWERDIRSEKRSLELQKRGMLNSSMVNLTIQQCLDDTDDFCRNTPKTARKGQHWKNGQHNSKPYWLFHKRFERGQQTEGRPTSTGFVRNGPKKLLGQRRSRRDRTSEAAARLRNQKWHPTTYAAPVGREPKGKRPKPTVKKKKKAKNNVSPTMCVP